MLIVRHHVKPYTLQELSDQRRSSASVESSESFTDSDTQQQSIEVDDDGFETSRELSEEEDQYEGAIFPIEWEKIRDSLGNLVWKIGEFGYRIGRKQGESSDIWRFGADLNLVKNGKTHGRYI